MGKVLVGPKKRHLEIPHGFKLIVDVPMKEGDLCADLLNIKWTPIENDDVGVLPWQDYVIRQIAA
jgi:hypothetical protein